MRWLALLVVVLSASRADAAPPSNPAFLGIGMADAPQVGCAVNSITRDSPAEDAGVRVGDMVVAIEDVRLATGPAMPCDTLRSLIMEQRPGESIKLDLRRGGQAHVVRAALSTRADVLHRRLVDQRMTSAEIVDVDNAARPFDLAEKRNRTTIAGFFIVDRCVGCAAVFDKVAEAVKRRLGDRDPAPLVQAITSRPAPDYQIRKSFVASVPVAYVEATDFDDLALRDTERVYFIVIDCRGIVRFVAPIAPGADDLDAAIDELLAASEQSEYLRTRR